MENRLLFVKKRERRDGHIEDEDDDDRDEESKVIDKALDDVESQNSSNDKDIEYNLDDFEDDEDDLLFADDDDTYDDDDEGVDGWYEDFYGGSKWEELDEEEAQNMNREQRREAQRAKPKKKLPKKGFA